jgi:hypothetical protein
MWTRRFLLTGISIAALLAGLAFAGIWFATYLVLGGLAGVVGLGAVGVIIYPALWYRLIHSGRDYSAGNTLRLVAYTYGASCAIVILGVFAGMLYPSGGDVGAPDWGLATLSALAAILMALLAAAAVIAIPYAAIAGPIAFLHRLLMLRLFARPDADPTARQT